MPRIPIKSNKTAQEPKKAKPIAKVSSKQLDRLKAYKKVRDKFLKENLYCEYPNCNSMEVQLHHGRGRCGDLLTDVTHFHALCDTHHRLIELEPNLAKELGLSGNRLDK